MSFIATNGALVRVSLEEQRNFLPRFQYGADEDREFDPCLKSRTIFRYPTTHDFRDRFYVAEDLGGVVLFPVEVFGELFWEVLVGLDGADI